jgi:hypothetical protein
VRATNAEQTAVAEVIALVQRLDLPTSGWQRGVNPLPADRHCFIIVG